MKTTAIIAHIGPNKRDMLTEAILKYPHLYFEKVSEGKID